MQMSLSENESYYGDIPMAHIVESALNQLFFEVMTLHQIDIDSGLSTWGDITFTHVLIKCSIHIR